MYDIFKNKSLGLSTQAAYLAAKVLSHGVDIDLFAEFIRSGQKEISLAKVLLNYIETTESAPIIDLPVATKDQYISQIEKTLSILINHNIKINKREIQLLLNSLEQITI
jgi:ferritin